MLDTFYRNYSPQDIRGQGQTGKNYWPPNEPKGEENGLVSLQFYSFTHICSSHLAPSGTTYPYPSKT